MGVDNVGLREERRILGKFCKENNITKEDPKVKREKN